MMCVTEMHIHRLTTSPQRQLCVCACVTDLLWHLIHVTSSPLFAFLIQSKSSHYFYSSSPVAIFLAG